MSCRAGSLREVVITGNPVRDGLFGGSAANAASWAGFDPADDGLPVVYVTGGAQGSRLINQAVSECMSDLLERCRIIHQCGRQSGEEQDADLLAAKARSLDEHLRRRYFVTSFVSAEIGDVYALAGLVVLAAGPGLSVKFARSGRLPCSCPWCRPAATSRHVMRSGWRLLAGRGSWLRIRCPVKPSDRQSWS